MRRLLTPKWLALHALTVFLVLSFCILAYWQFKRGEAGNARSWGYAFQWPAFAIFVVYMWIRMMREELHPVTDEQRADDTGELAGSDPLPVGAVATAAYVDDDEDDDPELDAELAEYNRYLAELNERASRGGR